MKRFIKPSIIAVSLMTTIGANAASKSPSNAQLTAEIRKVSMQTQALQKEVRMLKVQLHQLKQTKKHQSRLPAPPSAGSARTRHHKFKVTQTGARHFYRNGREYHQMPGHAPIEVNGFNMARFMRGITVTTSPVMGLRSAFNASDLLISVSSLNEDLTLLQHRALFERMMRAEGFNAFERPVVVLSGALEGQVLGARGFGGARGDVDLSKAEIDVNAIVSRWASGFMSLEYDDASPATGSRVANSRVFLSRGFLTIGNLNSFPLYFSIGQMYAPFGRYAGGMITSALTLSMMRTRVRLALLGLSSGGFYAQVYGFRGNQTTGGGPVFKQGGGNVGYKHVFKGGRFDVGAGVISTIADSEGMQGNGLAGPAPPFLGFGNTPGGNALRNRVPGFDAHGELTIGRTNWIAEYLTATRRFSPLDMAFNGVGAQPRALHLEAYILFHLFTRPFNFGVAYGQTWQAFALNLPRFSYTTYVNGSIWKDTVESLEFRHDVDYRTSLIASGGAGFPMVSGGVGGTRNTVTFKIGVYF